MKKFFVLIAASSLAAQPAALEAQDAAATVDFGDDSGMYANDQECDDPRFIGRTMRAGLLTDNIGRDASDCRAFFEQGRISLSPLFAPLSDGESINYGDDASSFANDGECDDIRFSRTDGAQTLYIVEDLGHDAADCRASVEAGNAEWQGELIRPTQELMFKEQMTKGSAD